MDIKKLTEKVLEQEDIKEIPLIYVFTVMTCVLEAISSGECFYTNE